MAIRQIPVRPDLDQLKIQAKELLKGVRQGDPEAVAEFHQSHPLRPDPSTAKLADAQFALARSYGIADWPRLVIVCQMVNAIWQNDVETVRKLVATHPKLRDEDALGVKGNWGPPMSYAANLGRDEIIEMMRNFGASDVQYAFDRACLQGRLDSARKLRAMGAFPRPGCVMGPCETLNADGLAFLMDLGADLTDGEGDRLAPVGLILETYCRNVLGKHGCLEIAAKNGVDLPETPPMAFHRGRIDLLEAFLAKDPAMLNRTFSMGEIFPLELGCHADETLALCGTPLGGTTLLHMCIDYDEMEIAQWLIEKGADVNTTAETDADGFGGHTPLFGTVVCQTYATNVRRDDEFARLLLDNGANPNARASLRKQLRFVKDETLHEFRDVTSLSWGERFQSRDWVNRSAMKLIAERGGTP